MKEQQRFRATSIANRQRLYLRSNLRAAAITLRPFATPRLSRKPVARRAAISKTRCLDFLAPKSNPEACQDCAFDRDAVILFLGRLTLSRNPSPPFIKTCALIRRSIGPFCSRGRASRRLHARHSRPAEPRRTAAAPVAPPSVQVSMTVPDEPQQGSFRRTSTRRCRSIRARRLSTSASPRARCAKSCSAPKAQSPPDGCFYKDGLKKNDFQITSIADHAGAQNLVVRFPLTTAGPAA